MARNTLLSDGRLQIQHGKWEFSISLDWWGWGLGPYVQWAHEHYPFALCFELGPLLIGLWYDPTRRWREPISTSPLADILNLKETARPYTGGKGGEQC